MSATEDHAAALELLARAAEKSKRAQVAYSPGFIKAVKRVPDVPVAVPPLARLIQGGRGGEVRLKLYLLLTMIATQRPFDIRKPPTPYTLARTLALPQDSGPRRINSNLKWLERNHFIKRTKRPGGPPAIQLLDPQNPQSARLADPRQTRPWVNIPIQFWSLGWLLDLSPTGIAVLFALTERLGGRRISMYLTRDRRESYGLSHDTWTRGRHELEESGLLRVSRVPQGDDYDYRRLRNSYWINKDRLLAPPPPFDSAA